MVDVVENPPPEDAAPPRSRARVIARRAAIVVVALSALVVVVAATAFWLLGREATLQRIVAEGERALHGQLQVVGVTGSLVDHVAFERLVFRSKTQVVTVEHGALRYRLEPFERRFTIIEARAAKLTIETIAKSDEPVMPPDTLELPAGLRIDTLRIAALHLDALEFVDGDRKTVLTQGDLTGRYATAGLVKRWVVERVSITTPWGAASGAGRVDATKPFALAAEVEASGSVDDVAYRAPVTASGTLTELDARSDFSVADPSGAPVDGRAAVHVLPFRDQPLATADVHVAGFAPKRWNAAWPDADVALDASLRPLAAPLAAGGSDPFGGTLRVTNARPGPIDRGGVPVARIDADLTGDSLALVFSRIDADLGAAGHVDGSGRYAFANGGALAFDGAVRALDLRAVHGRLVASKFAGPVAVSRADGIVRVRTALADARRSISFDGALAGEDIRVAALSARLGDSRIDAAGHVRLDGERPFEVSGTALHVDPRDFGDFTKGDVNATFKLAGSIGAQPVGRAAEVFRVAADVRLDPSRIAERPVAGTVVGTVDGSFGGTSSFVLRQVAGAHVALAIGADRATADGDFGRPQDRLRWTLDAPRLADLGVGASGTLKGAGVLGGTLAEPSLDFDLAGDALRMARAVPSTPTAGTAAGPATAVSVKSLRASGHVLAGASGRVDVDVALTELRDGAAAGPPTVQRAEAKVSGTRDAHRLTVTAASDRFDVTAVADGGLDARNTWRGDLTRLDNRGRVPVALVGSAPVAVALDRVDVGAAELRFDAGTLVLERLAFVDGRLATAGRASGLPLSLVASFSRDFAARVATTLTFGAEWDVKVGDAIDGHVRVFREGGNVRFLTDPRLSIDPERLEVDADIVADRVTARVAAVGTGLGRIEGSVETMLSKREGRWGLAGDAPLATKGDVDIPDLRWLGRLSGVPGLELTGALQAAVTGEGTVARPLLAGHASGRSIGLRWPDQGVNARDGRVELDFDGDRVILREAVLAAGDGRVEASGDLLLADRLATGALAVKFEHFAAVSRSDRTMVVSGTGTVHFGATGVDVTADVRADRGALQLVERRGPTMSNDIVIVGRDAEEGVAAPSTPVRFDVKFDMGDDFAVKGSGFDGKLGGTIRIAGIGTDLKAIGTVQVREGTYQGYGQQLTIDRGNLVFSGPIDNPSLDIVATRKNLAVEAGVQVSGTALAPQAKLTSTPNVPDTEKLSWLVLGHGLAASTKSDYGTLTSAAAGLLGSSDSTSIQSRIAATLGVDEVGVSGGGDKGGLLTVGKQISSKLRVTFEQGITKAATLVKLRYNIYKRIDLQVQTGTESALDVFYTFSFD